MSGERVATPSLLDTIDDAADSLKWAIGCISLGECAGLRPSPQRKAKAQETLIKLEQLQLALGRRPA